MYAVYVCVSVCACDAKWSQLPTHGSGESPAAPNSPLWVSPGKCKPHANVYNLWVVCVFLSCQHQCALFLHCSVTSAGNESHPPIADEDERTDKLYRLTKAKNVGERPNSLKTFCPFSLNG